MRVFHVTLLAALTVVGCLSMTSPANADPPPAAFTPPADLTPWRTGFGLNAASEKLLLQNGFVVLDKVQRQSLNKAYPSQGRASYSLVTTDALLQLWASLHQDVMQAAERDAMIPSLTRLLPGLRRSAAHLHTAASGKEAKVALREVEITLAVAERLLLPAEAKVAVAPDMRPTVDGFVRKVLAHHDVEMYPGEDYTLYTVRGYYADDPTLSRYFRASLWLTRRFFAVPPAGSGDSESPLCAAVALAAVVRQTPPEAQTRLARLQSLRELLTGPPNAVSATQLAAALDRALGQKWTLHHALQPDALIALRRELAKPEYPTTQARTRIVQDEREFPKQIVALLPGMALPDSILFRDTTEPAVAGRGLPTGLEVAAALGSAVAREQIRAQEPGHAADVLNAVEKRSPLLLTDDGKTVYSGWLHALSTLFTVPANAPAYMRGGAWQAAKVDTALSGWAHLRHNYLLYGEQNAPVLSLEDPNPALVEPNPAFFQAMAQLAGRTRLALAPSLNARYVKLLTAYEAKCGEFAGYAQAELTGTLTRRQSEKIDQFGAWLEQFTPANAAEVVDVAADGHGRVLHVATGSLKAMLVLPDPKKGQIYTGWVMSYYEFTRPNFERMTDARWQAEQQDIFRRPERPVWASAFLAADSGPDWDAHAPLREAEGLLLENKTDAGLALLRKTIAEHPDATLATEAQFRIGKFYFDRKDWNNAVAELRRCLRLPGCAAADTAKILLGRIDMERQAEEYRQTVTIPAERKAAAQILEMEAQIKALVAAPNRRAAERRLTARLLHDLPWSQSFEPDIPAVLIAATPGLLPEAERACRTPACRDALRYANLLATSSRWQQDLRASAALRYFQTAKSRPLRASALGMALHNGYLAGKPKEALALVRPFLELDPFAGHDEALRLLREAVSASPFRVSVDPQEQYQEGIQPLRNALVLDAFYAGRVEEAAATIQMFGTDSIDSTDQSDFDISGFAALWNTFKDRELPALKMLGIAQGLDAKHQEKKANAQYLAVADKYPHSLLAPLVLGHVLSRLHGPLPARQAAKLRERLLRDYPGSYPALCLQVESAFNRGDTARTQRLLSEYEAAKSRVDFEIQVQFREPARIEVVGSRLAQDDGKRKAIQSLLDAAHDRKLASSEMLESNGVPLAEGLAKALPTRAAEVYATLAGLYKSPLLARRFLERFPDDPRAGEMWKQLLGPEFMQMPGTFDLGYPAGVDWLRPFVERGPSYTYASEAARLMQQVMQRTLYGEPGLRALEEQARRLRAASPHTRTAQVVGLAAAHSLLDAARPEAALAYLPAVLAALPKNDPLHAEAQRLKARADAEIAAKRQPEWKPLWTVKLRPPGDQDMLDTPLPVTASGLLLACEPDANGVRQIVALEAADGQRRWTSAFRSGVTDVAVLPETKQVFCALQSGTVASLDLQTGKSGWERTLDPAQPLDGVTTAGKTVVAYGQGVGFIGLSPENGTVVWKQPAWKLVKIGRSVSGEPAVAGDTVVAALNDSSVRAFSGATGTVLWEKTYPAPDLSRLPANRRPVRPPILGQPLACGGDVLLVSLRPELQLSVVNARTGAIERAAGILPTGSVGRFSAGAEHVVEWNFNGPSSVRRLSDLSYLPVHVPVGRGQAAPPIVGQTLFVYLNGSAQLQAIDLDTGAVLAQCAVSGGYSVMIAAGDRHVFVVAYDGTVYGLPLPARGN